MPSNYELPETRKLRLVQQARCAPILAAIAGLCAEVAELRASIAAIGINTTMTTLTTGDQQ